MFPGLHYGKEHLGVHGVDRVGTSADSRKHVVSSVFAGAIVVVETASDYSAGIHYLAYHEQS